MLPLVPRISNPDSLADSLLNVELRLTVKPSR